jgi:hypothetical protein
MSLVSSANTAPPHTFGNDEVPGWVTPSGKDPAKATSEFFIDPARLGPNLFDPSRNLRSGSCAELAGCSFTRVSSPSLQPGTSTAGSRSPAISSPPASCASHDEIQHCLQRPHLERARHGSAGPKCHLRRPCGPAKLSAFATIQHEGFREPWPALQDCIPISGH